MIVKTEPKEIKNYNGWEVSDEMYELLTGFEEASLTYAKTAAEYIDKIGKQGRNDRLDNEKIRRLIVLVLERVGYSKGHIRKVIAENLPELIHHEFANKPKPKVETEVKEKEEGGEAIKMSASEVLTPTPTPTPQKQLPQEVTNLVHYGNEEPIQPEPQLTGSYKNKTPPELRLIIKNLLNKLDVKKRRIKALDNEIEKLEDIIKEKDERIENLKNRVQEIAARCKDRDDLKQEVDELKATYEPEISLVQLVRSR